MVNKQRGRTQIFTCVVFAAGANMGAADNGIISRRVKRPFSQRLITGPTLGQRLFPDSADTEMA